MASKNQQTFAKRQREQRKAEKAAQKRARRAMSSEELTPPHEAVEGDPSVEQDDTDRPNDAETPSE